jgi:type II secretory pathway component PulF
MMGAAVREFAIWTLVWFAPIGIVSTLVYLFLTLPPRRAEQARLFLDILQTGQDRGDSPERTILAVSETRERSLGVRFHLLAARIEEGMTLGQALNVTRTALPATIAEIVSIGASQNTLAKLLPAARTALNETGSRLRSGLNYVIVLFFVLGPCALVLLTGFLTRVGPRMQQMFVDMAEDAGAQPPALSRLVFENVWALPGISLGLLIAVGSLAVFWIWGDGALRFARIFLGSIPDRLLLLAPWRRYRAQRDFTAVLAALLDAGLNEADALRLAARATANSAVIARAKKSSAQLAAGQSLPAALRALSIGEGFHWRWANALRSGKDFFAALRGWHEWLNAKAFQQEQAATHAITTTFVLLNGAIVLLVVAAVFQVITAITEAQALW